MDEATIDDGLYWLHVLYGDGSGKLPENVIHAKTVNRPVDASGVGKWFLRLCQNRRFGRK